MGVRKAIYKGSLDGSSPVLRPFPVNDNQTITAGDIVVLATAKASIAGDAPSAGTVIGISHTPIVTATATATDIILADVNPNSIYDMLYIGSATPVIGAKYDTGTVAYAFDADDTTGGYIQVIGNVNTTKKRADVLLTNRAF